MSLRPELDLERLLDLLERCAQLHAVPALMRQVVEGVRERGGGAERYRGLRTLFVGGDVVPAELLNDLREVFSTARVEVLYGPTEATIICSAFSVPAGAVDRVSIGRPLVGAALHLCAPDGALVPLGAPGEIRVGGAGVARGYLHRRELTAE